MTATRLLYRLAQGLPATPLGSVQHLHQFTNRKSPQSVFRQFTYIYGNAVCVTLKSHEFLDSADFNLILARHFQSATHKVPSANLDVGPIHTGRRPLLVSADRWVGYMNCLCCTQMCYRTSRYLFYLKHPKNFSFLNNHWLYVYVGPTQSFTTQSFQRVSFENAV
jgi:hypothetical protein